MGEHTFRWSRRRRLSPGWPRDPTTRAWHPRGSSRRDAAYSSPADTQGAAAVNLNRYLPNYSIAEVEDVHPSSLLSNTRTTAGFATQTLTPASQPPPTPHLAAMTPAGEAVAAAGGGGDGVGGGGVHQLELMPPEPVGIDATDEEDAFGYFYDDDGGGDEEVVGVGDESGGMNSTGFYTNASMCSSSIIEASHATYLYGIVFLVVVSLLLNALCVIIFRSRGLRKYPFSLYLVVIGIVDTLSLCTYIPRKWLAVFYMALDYSERRTFYDTNSIACKSLTYFTYVLRFLSSWLLVALGTDRLFVTSTPYKRSKYPTLRSAQHGLCYCIVAAILFNAHVLFIWDSAVVADAEEDSNSGSGSNDGRGNGGGSGYTSSCIPMSTSPILALGLTILTVILIVVLPFVVIGALAGMIVRNLPAWNLRPRRLSSTVVGRALFERDATVMVVALLVAYCVFCVPYIITWVVLLWQHFLDDLPLCRYIEGAAARDIAEVGFMINFAIKFLLCIFFGGDVLNHK